MAATRVVLLLFLVFLAISCKAGVENRETTARESYEPTEPVVVTRADPSLPAGCRPREVAGLITNFFEAFNNGDQDRLSRFFDAVGPNETQPPVLYAAYINREKGFGTKNENELLDYFAERHEQKERLKLIKVGVGKSERPNSVDITFVVTRRAEDLTVSLDSPEHIAIGKGSIDCRQQTFLLWNMTLESVQNNARNIPKWPCKEPSDWKAGKAALACARGQAE